MSQLYFIRYTDADGLRKIYLNRTCFTHEEAIREIQKIKKDFPHRKHIRPMKINETKNF
jgi:hypothetical protein